MTQRTLHILLSLLTAAISIQPFAINGLASPTGWGLAVISVILMAHALSAKSKNA